MKCDVRGVRTLIVSFEGMSAPRREQQMNLARRYAGWRGVTSRRRALGVCETALVWASLTAGCNASSQPTLTHAEPSVIVHGQQTTVRLSGQHLSNSLRVDLDSRRSADSNCRWSVQVGALPVDPERVRLLDSHTLSVIVPASVPLGAHDVAVTTPGGAHVTLHEGITVVDANLAATSDSTVAAASGSMASSGSTASDAAGSRDGDSTGVDSITATTDSPATSSDGFDTSGLANPTSDESTAASDVSSRDGGAETNFGQDAASDDRGVLNAALVHRYSFERAGTTVTDSVGGAHGTFIAGSLDGVSGAARFTAGGGYIDLPNALISGREAVTIEVWLIWDAPDSGPAHSWQRIFDFGSNSAVEGLQGAQDTHLFLSPRSGGPMGGLHLAYRGDLTGSVTLNATAPLTPAVLEHVTAVVDGLGGRMELYVDGASIASRVLDFPLSLISDRNNWLGRSQVLEDPAFQGRIFEFRIYDGALSAQSISASYALGPDVGL